MRATERRARKTVRERHKKKKRITNISFQIPLTNRCLGSMVGPNTTGWEPRASVIFPRGGVISGTASMRCGESEKTSPMLPLERLPPLSWGWNTKAETWTKGHLIMKMFWFICREWQAHTHTNRHTHTMQDRNTQSYTYMPTGHYIYCTHVIQCSRKILEKLSLQKFYLLSLKCSSLIG